MRASELKPGQFFDSPYVTAIKHRRHLVVDRHDADQQLEVFHQTSGCLLRYHFNNDVLQCPQCWDEAPPVAKPEPAMVESGVCHCGLPMDEHNILSGCTTPRDNPVPAWMIEPEQFTIGDWLYCTESHTGIVAGKVYKVLAVKRDGWPEVEEGQGYWSPKYFRRATADEIAANNPDADGWIEHSSGEMPVNGDALVQIKDDINGIDSSPSTYQAHVLNWNNSTRGRYKITHYRLVNPPTPELTWTVEVGAKPIHGAVW